MLSAGLIVLILILVLGLLASGRLPPDLVAAAGLLLLGLLGVSPAALFSGFGHPAVITIAAVMIVSEALVNSGALTGLGKAIASRARTRRGQILGLAGVTAVLSAFMNNVGALGMTLPTALRMARRSGTPAGEFGLPLVLGAILGGSLTAIGTASNLIVSSYRASVTGQPFSMFSFLPHGLALLTAGAVVWLVGTRRPTEDRRIDTAAEEPTPLSPSPSRRWTMLVVAAAIAAATRIPASIAFPAAALVLLMIGTLPAKTLYRAVDVRVLVFIASLLGLGQIAVQAGAFDAVRPALLALAGLPPAALVAAFLLAATAVANAVGNAAAPVVLMPMALELAGGSGLLDALLMAIAAGSSLAVILPTHQATVMAMSQAPFPTGRLLRFGLPLVLVGGVLATVVITLIWT